MSYSFGPFELLKRLASGGMGEVYLARRTGVEGFEKLTVIKTLLPHLIESEEFLTMFLDEARLAARLDHGNIGQIFELGDVGGTYYISMEYILGEDLQGVDKRCREHKVQVPVPLICRIASDALAGLHYSHELTDNSGQILGLVHRDVSPHNILVTYQGGVKLIDFGVAKAAGRMTHTSTGQVKGKFAYMPPEQAWGEEVDRRADIFALGIVMHELLTNRPLFKRDTEVGTIKAISDCQVSPPSQINPQVPASLDPIVLKALARDKEQRYATAEAFRHAIENWLVANRQQASTAHLAAFMQKLYADNLQQQQKHGPLWHVDPKAEVEPPKGYRPEAAVAQGGAGLGGSKAGLIAAAVAAVLLVGGGAAFMATRGPSIPAQPVVQQKPTEIKLSIETDPPGVSATLDGEVIGMTPIRDRVVSVRDHATLELEAPGLISRSETLSLDQDLKLSFAMKKAVLNLPFESEPAGAQVKLGEQTLGTTPFEWQTKPGTRLELIFSKKGYVDNKQVVVAAEGLVVRATLKKRGRGKKKDDFIPTF